jgi:membrane-associated phospholipid phosphatase
MPTKPLQALAALAMIIACASTATAQEAAPLFTLPVSFVAQEEPKPSQPAHTGLVALGVETLSDFKAFPGRQSTWVILAIGAGAAAAAHPADDSVNTRLAGSTADTFFVPGKWVGQFYTLAGVSGGLYLVGRYVIASDADSRTNRVSHLGFDLTRALIVDEGLTEALKIIVRRTRPTGDCCSFPSGHASATFAVASVLERHFGYRGAWPTFLIAGYVATSRLHDDVHFLSDVVFGASLGIASGWTVVGRHGHDAFTLTPTPIPGGVGVTVAWAH